MRSPVAIFREVGCRVKVGLVKSYFLNKISKGTEMATFLSFYQPPIPR